MGFHNGQFSVELTDYQRTGRGPADYDDCELQRAHSGMGISREDSANVVSYRFQKLEEAGVGQELVERVGNALADTEYDVVSAGAC